VTIEGVVKGHLLTYVSNGGNGFGYDPLFAPEGYEMTFADMLTDEKNRLSHRGRAVAGLPEALEKLMEG
jgi:XTP/dITP diphosphohydrolase